jgi:hypothetical protein
MWQEKTLRCSSGDLAVVDPSTNLTPVGLRVNGAPPGPTP